MALVAPWSSVYTLVEEVGHRKESLTIDDKYSFSTRLSYDGAWSNRLNVAFDLFSRRWPDLGLDLEADLATRGAGNTYYYSIPICTKIDIHGSGTAANAGTGVLAWDRVLLDVSYEVIDTEWDVDSGDNLTGDTKEIATENISAAIEFSKLDPKKFRWSSSGKPVTDDEAPGVQKRQVTLERTVKGVSSFPSALLNDMGKVNQHQYVSATLGKTFGPETLLLGVPTISRSISVFSSGLVSITGNPEGWTYGSSFTYNPDGWNKFLRQDTGQYERLKLKGTGADYNPYPVVDMRAGTGNGLLA